jgi:hypothetical protein
MLPKFIKIRLMNGVCGDEYVVYASTTRVFPSGEIEAAVNLENPIYSIHECERMVLNFPMYDSIHLDRKFSHVDDSFLRIERVSVPVEDTEVDTETEVENEPSVEIVNETPLENKNEIDLDQTQAQSLTYDQTASTIIASDTEEEESIGSRDLLRLRDGPVKRSRTLNRDTIWLSKKRKVRSDKGVMRGIECPLCNNGRVLVHICKTCKMAFCNTCLRNMIGKGVDADKCAFCRSQI